MPLAQNPLFADDIRQGKTLEALRITKLDTALVDKLDAGQKQLEAWNDFDWENAVEQNILTPAQRDDLFFTTRTQPAHGRAVELVAAARETGLNGM